jgi:hypothetical protein
MLTFPLYTKILWVCCFACVYDFAADLMFPFHLDKPNSVGSRCRPAFAMQLPAQRFLLARSLVYGSAWALYHFVFEGIAFLLIPPGAVSRVLKDSQQH